MFLEIMKYINKFVDLKNAGVRGSSQLVTSQFSLEIKVLAIENSN